MEATIRINGLLRNGIVNTSKKCNPSINYLELYAVTVGIYLWITDYANQQICLFCDNMSVVHMINSGVSKCPNCMVLLRLITLQSLKFNVVVKAKHVQSASNQFADLISRLEYKKFRQLARKLGKKFDRYNTPIPELLWPMSKLWVKVANQSKRTKAKSKN